MHMCIHIYIYIYNTYTHEYSCVCLLMYFFSCSSIDLFVYTRAHRCMSVKCDEPDFFHAAVLQSREQALTMDPSALAAAAFAFGQCFEAADVAREPNFSERRCDG